MVIKQIKRDSSGRRTDRVKKRELKQMLYFHLQGLTYLEIANRLGRKPQTVKLHIKATQQLDEENRLTEKESIRQKEAQQIGHVTTMQELVREFLDSIVYPADKDNLDDLEEARNSLWRAFKKIRGDERWPKLAAHLGEYEDAFYKMTDRLEPPELAEMRKNPGKPVVVTFSIDDITELIDEAREFIDNSYLNFIVEQPDTLQWEFVGLKRWCRWCPIRTLES